MEDYLGAKKDGRTFKDNLLSFWDILVCESQESALFDQQLMEKCMDYVIALSWYGALRRFYYYLFFCNLSCALTTDSVSRLMKILFKAICLLQELLEN